MSQTSAGTPGSELFPGLTPLGSSLPPGQLFLLHTLGAQSQLTVPLKPFPTAPETPVKSHGKMEHPGQRQVRAVSSPLIECGAHHTKEPHSP
jgi:hypothetical protein